MPELLSRVTPAISLPISTEPAIGGRTKVVTTSTPLTNYAALRYGHSTSARSESSVFVRLTQSPSPPHRKMSAWARLSAVKSM